MPAASGDSAPPLTSAVGPGRAFGLYPAADFRLADGRCADCPTIRQALWYFEGETIAVPKAGVPVATFAPGVAAIDDLRQWLPQRRPGTAPEHPPLVWVAAPDVIAGARLAADATVIEHAGGRVRLALVPKIPLNRSYFDASSAQFLLDRALTVRGRIVDGRYQPWPELRSAR